MAGSNTSERIADTVQAILPLDVAAMPAARERHAILPKSAGSLGRLEEFAAQFAGISGCAIPDVTRKAVVVIAADRGIAAEGVSAYPAEVTAQMLLIFLASGTAINALAAQGGARVVVVDMSVSTAIEQQDLCSHRIAGARRHFCAAQR